MSITFYRTDRWGNQLGTLQNVSSAQRDRTTTGTDTVDIESTTQCAKGDRIVFKDATGTVREYIVSDLEQAQTDYLMFTYHLVNSVTELSLYFIEDRRVRGGNALTAITRALEGTRWSVGDIEASSELDISFYHQSAYDSLLDICNDYGLEYETVIELNTTGDAIISRTINLTSHIGSTTVRRFDFGRNLSGLTRTIDSSDVITRLYPYGNGVATEDEEGEETGGYSRKITIEDVNDGIPYIEDEEATQLWGVPGPDGEILPAMGTEDFDTDDPQELLEMAQAALPSLTEPTITYEATVAVLGIESQSRLAVGVGDDVVVVDTAYPSPIRLSGRVLEIQDDLLDPLGDGTTITLGNLDESFTSSMNTVSSQVSSMVSSSSAWDDAATASGSYVDAVVNVMNEVLNQTGGYVYFTKNEGIFVYDRPVDEDPTMVIQIGGGYFRIADSKDSNGDWEWRTMGSGSGLVADSITTGTITGGLGTWDLDNGVLKMYDADGNLVVYLSSDKTTNLLVGSFSNGLENGSTSYVYIPEEAVTYTGDPDDPDVEWQGNAILFYPPNRTYETPGGLYYAYRNDDEDDFSRLTIYSGQVAEGYANTEIIGHSDDASAEVRLTATDDFTTYGENISNANYGQLSLSSNNTGSAAIIAHGSSNATVNMSANGASYCNANVYAMSTNANTFIGNYNGSGGNALGLQISRSSGLSFSGRIYSNLSYAPTFQYVSATGGSLSANNANNETITFSVPTSSGTYRGVVSGRATGGVMVFSVTSQSSSGMTVHIVNGSSSTRDYGYNLWAFCIPT